MQMEDKTDPNSAQVFRWPARIYYEDTDAAGVVYHANYLCLCERARTEWLRALGIDQRALMRESSLAFVVTRIEADYLRGAELDDLLEVQSSITSLGAASLVFAQHIHRGAERLFSATVTIACVDWARRRPARIPAPIRALMKEAT